MRSTRAAAAALLTAALLTAGACATDPPGADTGTRDAAPRDASLSDARADAAPDADPPADAEALDASSEDAAAPDAESDAGPTTAVGDPCSISGPFCSPGQICLDVLPGGYCTYSCSGRACPEGSSCLPFLGEVCIRRCMTDADCRYDEGYACEFNGHCLELSELRPGRRPDGSACHTTSPGPHQIPALIPGVFSTAEYPVSELRTDSFIQAEGTAAISTVGSTIAASYIAIQPTGGSFIGMTTFRPTGSVATTTLAYGSVPDPIGRASDPVVAYTAGGMLHLAFVGFAAGTINPTDFHIRVSESTDGQNWTPARAIEPPGSCAVNCDKPWLVVGRHPTDPYAESLYITYVAAPTQTQVRLQIQRSDDGGLTWTPPTVLARGTVNMARPFVAADGTVYVKWGAFLGLNPDPGNQILISRSTDGAANFSTPIIVNRPSDTVPFHDTGMVVSGGRIYVNYVTGNLRGAWNIILADSTDLGMTWNYRRVNDEPEDCASHAFPALAAEAGVAHLVWIDNRFGPAQFTYASCPDDAPCGRNELLSTATFPFTFRRDKQGWLGDYGSLVIRDGELWALWTDPRIGRSAIYVSKGLSP